MARAGRISIISPHGRKPASGPIPEIKDASKIKVTTLLRNLTATMTRIIWAMIKENASFLDMDLKYFDLGTEKARRDG